jgi:uncharacterized protein YndB with AHSA1/START domain
MEKEISSDTSRREIISTRIFNYPLEYVFKAWEDPTLLASWWGPKDFTNTFHEFDFRPGGNWRFTMHGPNGIDYHNKCVYVEIIKPTLIIFNHIEPVHSFQVTASFEEMGNKTNLSFRMLFDSLTECDKVRPYVVDANEQNFDRLEMVLSNMTVTL